MCNLNIRILLSVRLLTTSLNATRHTALQQAEITASFEEFTYYIYYRSLIFWQRSWCSHYLCNISTIAPIWVLWWYFLKVNVIYVSVVFMGSDFDAWPFCKVAVNDQSDKTEVGLQNDKKQGNTFLDKSRWLKHEKSSHHTHHKTWQLCSSSKALFSEGHLQLLVY